MKKTDTVEKEQVATKAEAKEKRRYSDEELQEFKLLIQNKLEEAKTEAQILQDMLKRAHDNGTDDTARTFKNLEDGSDTLAKEELGQMVSRQQKFIEQLELALVRIETKTYGICHISGKLIPKERLRIVPHTTQCIEAKLRQEK
jgi:DnaK suppressor protein